LAETKIRERSDKQAAEARRANEAIRDANRKRLLLIYGGWLAFVLLIYILGWSIGWIYRGFKAT
jgi:hypothetical protein